MSGVSNHAAQFTSRKYTATVGLGFGRRRLPSIVVRLGWISFLADVCSEMAYPILPLLLAGPMRAPAATIGLIEGAAEAVVSLVKGWSGRWSDRMRRRAPFLVGGYALSAAAKPLLAISIGWPGALGARLLDRFGKGFRTSARDAMIAEAADPAAYGYAYGFHRALDTAGAFVGVLVTLGLLAALPGDYRTILLLAAIPGAASVWLAITVRDRAPGIAHPAEEVGNVPWLQAARSLGRPYWRAVGILAAFALCNTSDAFLILRASQAGGLGDRGAIGAYLAYNVVAALVATHAGLWSDRWGRWRVLAAGWFLFAGVYFGFSRLSGPPLFGLFALYGLYYGLSHGVSRALAADYAPPTARGTAIGLFGAATGIATLAGNVAMGAIWDRWGSAAALSCCAAGALAALALLAFAAPRGPAQKDVVPLDG